MKAGRMPTSKIPLARKVVGLLFVLAASPALADLKPDLVEQLRQGGFVLLMRHASSPQKPPGKSMADSQNMGLERQLDEQGRETAEAMGHAFKALRIPVATVLSSPTYRALETVRLARFGTPRTVAQLGDQGHSMARLNGPGPAAWLQAAVEQMPVAGKNTIIITHMPNIAAAFPDKASGLQDGETLVFKPDGNGHVQLVAKVLIEDWPAAIPRK
jgi:phosphohistidine phosphatase SixA